MPINIKLYTLCFITICIIREISFSIHRGIFKILNTHDFKGFTPPALQLFSLSIHLEICYLFLELLEIKRVF